MRLFESRFTSHESRWLLIRNRLLQRANLVAQECEIGLITDRVIGKLAELDVEVDGVTVDARLSRIAILQVLHAAPVVAARQVLLRCAVQHNALRGSRGPGQSRLQCRWEIEVARLEVRRIGVGYVRSQRLRALCP